MAKCLITGLSNSGKTSLLKTLTDCLVVSRDGKAFPFDMPHFNVLEYNGMSNLIKLLATKIEAYKKKFEAYPKTIAFDSVSRIFTDVETYCSDKYSGFDIWSNVNREIQILINAILDLENEGFNIVLIAHCVWDDRAGKFIETCKGNFAKTGGFLSIVDYAVNIEIKGKKRIVNIKEHSLSRTLLDDMPEKMEASEFNLQEYIDKINAKKTAINKFEL